MKRTPFLILTLLVILAGTVATQAQVSTQGARQLRSGAADPNSPAIPCVVGPPYTDHYIRTTDHSEYQCTNAAGIWTKVASGSLPADQALDNLASVAVNASLNPGTDNSINLGSASKRWADAQVLTLTAGTSILSPLVIGGSAVGSNAEIRSTSGTGTTDYVKFTGGTNGGTEFGRFTHSGFFGIGETAPNHLIQLKNAVSSTSIGGNVMLGIDNNGIANRVSEVGLGSLAGSPTANFPGIIGFKTISVSGNTNGDMYFGTRALTTDSAAVERMRIFASGGISIGNTTDPGATNLSVTGTVTDGSLTSGRVTYAGTSGVLSDDSGFTYNSGTHALTTTTFVGALTGIASGNTLLSVVPNTLPSAGQILVGNAGGTAYAPVAISSDATLASTGALTLASTIAAGGPTGSATVAPIITYDAKGRLTTVTSATITPAVGSVTGLGTGVATALGNNVGSAGAFVAFGGALGSPSSAGTMPAFTFGGTVSGGGNQVNNVIIGTTNPLAGFFTTASATTSVTSPVRIGGSAVGSNAEIRSTSATGTTDYINFTVGTNGGTEAARITHAAFMGIGETAPNALLQLKNAVSTTSIGGNRLLIVDNTGVANRVGEIGMGSLAGSPTSNSPVIIGAKTISTSGNTTSDLYFGTRALTTDSAAIERMRIFASGGVSIGNTTDQGIGTLSVTGAYYSGATVGCTGVPAASTLGIVTTCTSDEKFKTIVGKFTRGLDALAQVHPIRFHWNSGQPQEDPSIERAGFGAGNVQRAIPEAAWMTKQANGQEYLTLSDRVILATTVNAINELNAKVERLEREKTTTNHRSVRRRYARAK